jgi:hypothetical protein
MGWKGVEPSRSFEREILSLLRLPFRHQPVTTIVARARLLDNE